MPTHTSNPQDAAASRRRLFVYNGGFLTQGRVRRILELSGYDIRLGAPSAEGDWVGVWGQSPTSPRGEAVANRRDAPILRIEDTFLRSVKPGRAGGGPSIGLMLDEDGVHFDPSRPSSLERLLSTEPFDDTALLDRARAGIEGLQRAHLSKYSAYDPSVPGPDPGYVLVIDQTEGDASVTASRGDRNSFVEMLHYAQTDHPGARIIVKTHPETAGGHRGGYFRDADVSDRVSFFSDPISPWTLFEGAIAVYVFSSQMGFEAIMAGHKPVVFGQPFYAGWGLTDDRQPIDRRQRKLTRAQLFAGAMLLFPKWYDPYRDRLCSFEDAALTMTAQVQAWRDDSAGWVASGMRLWKRKPIQAVFGSEKKVVFEDRPDRAEKIASRDGRRHMVWASKSAMHRGAVRVEDGFLRSRGLGADLIPPLSLVLDDLGIYYDPTQESRLEQAIVASVDLPQQAARRAESLTRKLIADRLAKYNLGGTGLPKGLPVGRRILVPGQVEDDASILLGTNEIKTNRALLEAARTANPAAVILYKPHPDVEAGLRDGAVEDADALADAILTFTDPIAALDGVDEVWTMTSLLGFEGLIRDKRVTCLGSPFYAGWGLTDDRSAPIPRRAVRPSLMQLVHAVLIDYPRYFDPVTGLPCPVEVVAERLSTGDGPKPTKANRLLAKAQGLFASYAHFWR